MNLVGLVVIVLLGLALISTIHANYVLQKQIDGINQQVTGLNNDKAQLSYETQYDQTDAYKEEQARLQLGLVTPGENVIILPHTVPVDTTPPHSNAPKKRPKSNFQQWIDFLRGTYQPAH
jgi:hypothetical protein